MDRTPHNFLLHLRGLKPALARRFDGMRTLGLSAGVLGVRAEAASWSARELLRLRDEIEAQAALFFGPGTRFSVEEAPGGDERLPFPVSATKYWNHVVFLSWETGALRAVALPKPRYAALWATAEPVLPEGEGLVFDEEGAASQDPLDALPRLLDWAAALAREASSYAQFVAAFPGDAAADLWEARLHAVKEWGTPSTPAPILARFTGRLHYVDPDRPPLGIRLLSR